MASLNGSLWLKFPKVDAYNQSVPLLYVLPSWTNRLEAKKSGRVTNKRKFNPLESFRQLVPHILSEGCTYTHSLVWQSLIIFMASPWIYRELDIYEASSKIQSNVQRKSTYISTFLVRRPRIGSWREWSKSELLFLLVMFCFFFSFCVLFYPSERRPILAFC